MLPIFCLLVYGYGLVDNHSLCVATAVTHWVLSERLAGHPFDGGGDILCAGRSQNAVVIGFKACSNQHHP
jgi:hypothetical protein